MTTRTLQILLALAEGPFHGYGIRQRVADRTQGEVKLGSGTLYEAIHRLQEADHIIEIDSPTDEPVSGGPPRRFYALTTEGRLALRAELHRMDEVVQYARAIELLNP
jgi:DNA-binding PadR family transcriptional regulator